jgi:hypothetical protein
MPQRVKTLSRHLITVEHWVFEHGKAKGKREYSSIIVRMYVFFVADGRGPLKSMLRRSIGCVAFMSIPSGGL